jgi:hypothetical protein
MREQCVDGLLVTLHDVEHTGRQARFLGELGHA